MQAGEQDVQSWEPGQQRRETTAMPTHTHTHIDRERETKESTMNTEGTQKKTLLEVWPGQSTGRIES